MLIYTPVAFNEHTVRITFTEGEETGHIAFKVDGNYKGLDVLKNASGFFETCNKDDIANLIENDCDFAFNDDATFYIVLKHHNGYECTIYSSINESRLKELMTAVEIIDCVPQSNTRK